MKEAFKKDSKGKIRLYRIYTDDADLVKETGLLDGKLKEDRKTCKGKNIGRANETTPEQQAVLEMESDFLKKLDTGYFKTVEEAQNEEVILPMLAKEFGKEEHKINWGNAKAQFKLDGMRCLMVIDRDGQNKLISRQGKEILTLPHLSEDMSHLKGGLIPGGKLIFDGELYVHGESFQENMRLLKKYRPGESEKIRFFCYDMVSDNPFAHRYFYLKEYLRNREAQGVEHIDILDTVDVSSRAEVEEYHAKAISEGYEGVMVRWGSEGYKVNGRSSNLLKFKQFDDIALPVQEVIPNDANPEHGTPVFELNGNVFKAGVRMSHDERTKLMSNSEEYIGQTAEIRYFGTSETGVPRFPVVVGFRLDQ